MCKIGFAGGVEMRFQKKNVIVTGAGRGVGYQIAYDFAAEGANVIAVDIDFSGLDVLEEKAKELAGSVWKYQGDLSLQETNEAMIDYTVQKFGSLDILVNNAGVAGRFEPVGELTNELWERVLKVNLQAPMFAIRKAVNVMSGQEHGGNIVNIASVCGLRSGLSGVAYTVAKHGLIGLTQNTAYMYLKKGIRCNAVAPGGIRTTLIEDYPDDSPFGKARIAEGAGKGFGLGEPEDISSLVRYVASDEAKYINGSVLVADGGFTAY